MQLDPIIKRKLRQDLLRGLGEPFTGNPLKFWSWKNQISVRLGEAECGSFDSLLIMKANTVGPPNDLVSGLIDSGSHDPSGTLLKVWQELERRFGSSVLVAQSLLNKIDNIPHVKGNNNVIQLEDILAVCQGVLSNMAHCHELRVFDLQSGMKMIWQKLPDDFIVRWRKRWHNKITVSNFPPNFADFVEYFEGYISELSTPGFLSQPPSRERMIRTTVTRETERCLYHEAEGHLSLIHI